MNADVFQDRWKQVRSEAQRRWNRLTDQDLDEGRDQADRLAEAAGERYGASRPRPQVQANRFMDRYGNQVQARAQGVLAAARDFINDNPWAAAAVGMLLVGLAAGLLARPKARDDHW